MAAMLPIDDFIPLVTKHAPGFNDMAVMSAIRQAARALCEVAPIWREKASVVITEPSGQDLDAIEDAEIIRIETAFLNGMKLDPITIDELDERKPLWRVDTEISGSANYITQLMADQVTIYPLATGTLSAAYILKPSDEAESLPSVLKSRYPEVIGRGAASILLTSPSTDNPQLGLDHRSWFDGQIAEVKIKTYRGQQNGRIRASSNWF